MLLIQTIYYLNKTEGTPKLDLEKWVIVVLKVFSDTG